MSHTHNVIIPPIEFSRMESDLDVRLECEAEELRAEVAMQREQARILARERDEAREAFAIATNNCVDAQQRLREMERELNKAREDAKRATYDAAQETIRVSTVKSHWIEACRERDKARDTVLRLRKQRADWNKACDEQAWLMLECDGHRAKAAKLREALQSVMDWNPKPEYWERPETVARFEADMARAREVLEETQPTPNN